MKPFDLAVIGAGTAGLVTAAGAAGLGARVALIEKDRLGGECLYSGCVPTKALLKAAKVVHTVATSEKFGVKIAGLTLDYANVHQSIQRAIAQIQAHDSAERFRNLGITVLGGTARFQSPTRLEVANHVVAAAKMVIATGSRSTAPPIPGLAETGYWTHVEAVDAAELPRSMVILGGGPMGLEFAQAWARFGVKVTVLEYLPRILSREDAEIAEIARTILGSEGIEIVTGVQAVRVRRAGPLKIITVKTGLGQEAEYAGEEIFVAAGRAPNLEDLNLPEAGVEHDRRAILVDATLRTTVRNIWAVGDVAGPYLFTHTANYQGRLAVSNALFPFQRKAEYRVLPWVIFLDPEVAHLGLTEDEARERHGASVKVYRYPLANLDRAITDGEARGLIKVITNQKGHLLGAHIIGTGAGELIHELALAMQSGVKIGSLSSMIHAYPTYAEGIQRTADLYWREKLFSPSSPLGRWLKFAVRLFN